MSYKIRGEAASMVLSGHCKLTLIRVLVKSTIESKALAPILNYETIGADRRESALRIVLFDNKPSKGHFAAELFGLPFCRYKKVTTCFFVERSLFFYLNKLLRKKGEGTH